VVGAETSAEGAHLAAGRGHTQLMYYWLFLWRLKTSRIVAAIRAAELRTSGEIRVFISHKKCEDPLAEARLQFEKLKMHHTAQRNGVLLFVAPRSRSLAILGDKAVHELCGDTFWQHAADTLTTQLAAGKLTDGIVQAIQSIADVLTQHFPRQQGDKNELSDDVVLG
jgi:uncharacterized membrane protein